MVDFCMGFDVVGMGLQFIENYGLAAMLFLLVLDAALLLPIFPGEIVLIMAVAAYAHDLPSLITIILLTTAAGLAGSLLLYGIIRGGGRTLVDKYPRLFMMPKKRREKLEASFSKPSGKSLVLFLRFIPLTRILVNIPAGLAKMRVLPFVILTAVGLLGYHAGFLWFAYEANRPNSAISNQRQHLEQAYASPAWAFVEANQILAGIGLLLLGIVIATRAAIKMHDDPDESTGSIIGWATTVLLVFGGLALAVATYMVPDALLALILVGGLDAALVAARLGLGPLPVLWAVSGVAFCFGLILTRMRRTAKANKKAFKAAQARMKQRIQQSE